MAGDRVAPSGAQHVIGWEQDSACVTEVGATLRELTLAGLGVLDGFPADERTESGAGQLLIPWPNRLRDGRYSFGGSSLQLALTEPDKSNAIHGLTRWSSWRLEDRAASWVRLALRLHPQPGWPAILDLTATYALGDGGLTVAVSAENVGDVPAPFGVGAHPYVRLDAGTVDELTLTVPGATRLVTDDRSIPVGEEAVEGTRFDFRRPRRIGSDELDTAFTDLERDAVGGWQAVVTSASGASVALWADGQFSHVMAFTGDSLSGPRRRRSLGLEPMSCPPDAFNRPGSFAVIEPGGAWEGRFGITRLA